MRKLFASLILISFVFVQGCATIAGAGLAVAMEEEREEDREREKASRKLNCPYEHTKEGILGYYCNEEQAHEREKRRERLNCDDNEKVSYSATGYYCEDKY